MCSSSIPLEPEAVTVTVTAAGATPENSDAGPEHNHPQNAQTRTPAAVCGDAKLHGCASADSVPSPTRLPRSLQSGLETSPEDRSVGRSRRVVYPARVPVNTSGEAYGNWARPGSSGDRVSRGRSEDVPLWGTCSASLQVTSPGGDRGSAGDSGNVATGGDHVDSDHHARLVPQLLPARAGSLGLHCGSSALGHLQSDGLALRWGCNNFRIAVSIGILDVQLGPS